MIRIGGLILKKPKKIRHKLYFHMFLKQCALLLLLLITFPFLFSSMNEIQGDFNALIIVSTISGLLLAGSLSGFFTFSYNNVVFKNQLILGHISTGIQQLVIGMLLVVTTLCLYTYNHEYNIWIYFSFLSIALYISLITYDVFDISTLNKFYVK